MAQETVDLTDEIAMMIETMEQIKAKNVLWLKSFNNSLYKNIVKISTKLEKNKSKEKFVVELSQDGNLNLLNKKKNKFFYSSGIFDLGDEIATNIEEKIYKKITFDGTGLGTHITSIIRMFKPKKVTIIEKELQIFNSSLYVTDYEELNKISTIDFIIDKKYDLSKEKNIITIKNYIK